MTHVRWLFIAWVIAVAVVFGVGITRDNELQELCNSRDGMLVKGFGSDARNGAICVKREALVQLR